MGISDLLGAMMQAGMAPSSNQRLQNAFGGGSGGLLESLGGLLGGQRTSGGGLGDVLSGMLSGGGGGLGGRLGEVFGQVGQAAGGKQNLALGGLGALAGALLGGGGKSLGGALGGGVMALLGAMAFKALQGSGQSTGHVPLGLMEPQSEVERRELENRSELVLKAMINAAKADGKIDEGEAHRIVGKLQEAGADADDQRYILELMKRPMETETLISAAEGHPNLAAELYAASLMAIEVDTPAEKAYLGKLASGLGLTPEVTGRIEQMVGL
ncbi:MAG: tellurite resistance TerB family protein [Desulfobacterales bacterium]|jgi:uncharacterized membrane protein YebE (DUF533 family)|nr:tellurite resistance TerB family protein [Desulfobacterales bacterium]